MLNGFSKAFAMTGWRLGYVIGPRAHIRALQTLYGNFFIATNEFVQWAGLAALTEGDEESQRYRAIFDDRRRAMIAGLRAIGLGVGFEPTGAFYVLANARRYTADSTRLAIDILESCHVAVTPGRRSAPAPRGTCAFRTRPPSIGSRRGCGGSAVSSPSAVRVVERSEGPAR